MSNTFSLYNSSISSHRFGFDVMGPILAECCYLLDAHLKSNVDDNNSLILYCSRGGLVIRRAFELYLKHIEQKSPIASKDFMISRLAAARLAMIRCPDQAAPLLSLEFEGRNCAEVASVLSGKSIPCIDTWAHPYSSNRLSELLSTSRMGRNANCAIIEQANLLREHFLTLSSGATSINIVDTGVFGSIGHFLALGLPAVPLHSILLFRANYKQNAGIALPPAKGLVCNEDHYCPWKARSVSRLYWPFIEAFFEPDLPSVRTYRRDSNGKIVSNLQLPNWENQLLPKPGSIRAGAFDYLNSLEPNSVSTIQEKANSAWQTLQKRIIYPGQSDIALLGVSARGVDFGFDDVVSFGESESPRNPLVRIKRINKSIWPEGEIRRFFPQTARLWLFILETNRTLVAIVRTMLASFKIRPL